MTTKIIGDLRSTTTVYGAANYLIACRFQASATGSISQIKLVTGGSGYVRVAVYSDSSGSPSSRIAYNDSSQAVTSGTNTLSLSSSGSLTSGTWYWLLVICDTASIVAFDNVVTSNYYKYASKAYSGYSWPSSFSVSWSSNGDYMLRIEGWGDTTITITPSAIASAEAFGSPSVKQKIAPAGIASCEAFGSPTVARVVLTISPAGIPSAEAFGVSSIGTPTPVYSILVDWDNDGVFTGAYDDITADVKLYSFNRGKDSELGTFTGGTCELTLNNSTNKYSPEYSSSLLYGSVKPGRTIKILATWDGVTYNLFYGKIDRITPHPDWDTQDCYIYCVDGFNQLAKVDIKTSLYTSQLTGYLVGKLLDSASWPVGMRTLDDGIDDIPYWWAHKESALSAINLLEEAERSSFYIGSDGKARWEDRHHRLKHTASEATIDNDMQGIDYNYGLQNLINDSAISYTPKSLASSAEIWRYREVPAILASGSLTIWADLSSPASSITTPVAMTDYTANTKDDGTGVDKTSDISITITKYAQCAKLVITNSAAVTVYLTLMALRGLLVEDQEVTTMTDDDSTSQTDYGKQSFGLDNGFVRSSALAEAIATYQVERYKDPMSTITVRLRNTAIARWKTILSLDISSRVTVKHTGLGINADYFINKVSHEISEGGLLHDVTWELEKVDTTSYWILGTSLLGTETTLAF